MDLELITYVKSAILFFHIVGVALGAGGAWILDIYMIRASLKGVISRENARVVVFLSGLVSIGFALAWISGLSFICYYYLFQTEALSNPKLWAKLTVVVLMTINAFFIHYLVIPTIKRRAGFDFFESVSTRKINNMVIIGSVSCVSWLFAVSLGVFSFLNFNASYLSIMVVYFLLISFSLLLAFTLKSYLLESKLQEKVQVLRKSLNSANSQVINKDIEIAALRKYLNR